MRFVNGCIIVVGLWSFVVTGCGGGPTHGSEGPVGAIAAALQFPAVPHDVTAVRFDVVAATDTCDGAAVASRVVSLETEPLAASVAGAGSGSHQFADGLFVLGAGPYRACATPLAMEGTPSQDCARGEAPVVVVGNQTTEIVLVSQCKGKPTGGADIVVSLNDPPQISALSIDPSKFITICQSAVISLTASDPNGDALTYGWTILSGPAGASVSAMGSSATFKPLATGDYLLNVTVDDVHGARATLSFPIHVSADATCAVTDEVQNLISMRCSPCHTTGASGGLKMDTPTNTYANLVGKPVLGAACTDRTRVIPGDAANSYIVSKLRGAPGICGVQMPRGRPPLPETEINTIEAWINGLPH